jgi:hypothetical protein
MPLLRTAASLTWPVSAAPGNHSETVWPANVRATAQQ